MYPGLHPGRQKSPPAITGDDFCLFVSPAGFLPGQFQDRPFFRRFRVGDLHVQQEPVELRLRQGVCALLFDGILGRHDQVQLRQLVGFPADGDLPLGHGFQQCRLDLGRGPVHFIRQDQVMEQRPALEVERTVLGAVDFGAGQVGGQQVGRELHPVEIGLDTVPQHLDGAGLGQARRAFYQQVTIRQQRQQQPVHQLLLAYDVAGDEGLEPEDLCFL